MSSATAPYPYFNGITYNPSFFSSSSTGLTQGQANLLYLKKTTADTATALETFSGGISSNSLKTIATSDILDIATTQTSGAINIGSLPSRTGNINIGYSVSAPTGLGCNLNIGNILSNTSIGGKYVELASTTGGISLSTSGTLDLIATAYNMGTSLLSATNINIGTTGKSSTTIYGPLTLQGTTTAIGNITLTGSNILGGTQGATYNILNNLTSGTINFCGLSVINLSTGVLSGYLQYYITSGAYAVGSSPVNRDFYLFCNPISPTPATYTITLPNASLPIRVGSVIHLRNYSGFTLTVISSGGSIYPTVSTGGVFSPSWNGFANNTSQNFMSDGTNWLGF